MRRKGLIILALMVIGIVALANAARHTFSQQPGFRSTQINLEDSYTLYGPVPEDLVVVAETVDLQADSRVDGNVALIGSQVDVSGPVAGDLTVMAESVNIYDGAHIEGNTTLLADAVFVEGQIDGTLHVRSSILDVTETAAIGGQVFACSDELTDGRVDGAGIQSCEESDLWSSTRTLETLRDPNFVLPLLNITIGGTAIAVLFTALGSLALSGLSILAVVIFPRQISHIEEAVRTGSRGLSGTGLMIVALAAGVTFALGLAVVVVPVLGLVLVPVYIIAALLFCGMALAGWITVTLVVGDVLLQRINMHTAPPLIIAAIGNITLLLAWNLLVLHPITRIIAVAAIAVLGIVGLGAAFTTRMGTRPVHRSYLVQG
ncbi:MAG: hypothetical protein CL610_27225 [Anaerolineaceae bacterium]|nr:hypothetical protein [Anaerolineaceae bacterium]